MKYYRVLKDNFLWEIGAILKENDLKNGYVPIEDIWDVTEFNCKEYISSRIIENNPDWFERVYPDNLDKLIFKTKEELRKAFEKFNK
jgi:hypothetical protein